MAAGRRRRPEGARVRIEIPREVERFGAIRFGGLQKVFELDSGLKKEPAPAKGSTVTQVPYEALHETMKEMAIVVPIHSERLKLVEGVLAGIPHPCLIIVVSNSPRSPVDRFHMEKDALRDFCVFVNKNALIIHQKDPVLAKAFEMVGYKSVLDKQGQIASGKGEGMLIGILMARLAGKKIVGFVDADNYFPGAVEEYIREYAAGFHLANSRYAMTRISWSSKPKIAESKLFFRKWGRSSNDTNRLLNRLIGAYTGYETEIIKTGNAGEHAMTTDLAMRLEYSAGYSIETFEIVNLIEQFGGLGIGPDPEIMRQKVEVAQIESRNPHLHEAGDDEHVGGMLYASMRAIYHSPACPPALKDELLEEMARQHLLEKGQVPAPVRRYPSLSTIDLEDFMKEVESTPYARHVKEGKV